MVIETDATHFNSGWTSIIDGGATNVAAFEPTSGVPEPGSLLLVGLGMVGLASLRRLRRS